MLAHLLGVRQQLVQTGFELGRSDLSGRRRNILWTVASTDVWRDAPSSTRARVSRRTAGIGDAQGRRQVKQESLANAKVNARQHCVSLSCLCNSLTQIEWVVQLLLPPKHAKSREIPREFYLTAVQGHPRSSILVSIESPYVTSY